MFASESSLPVGARPGDLMAGKYRVTRVLGAGGMGVVVEAMHEQIGARVAIKFLLPHAVHEEALARFERETRASARIKSEHIARVLDAGTLEGGSPFIVMEFLEGRDLSRWLRDDGPLPIEQAVEFVLQVCEALAEMHALGIVHRDLKPANLFVVKGSDGLDSVKVLDFGISKVAAHLGDTDMTKTSAVLGTPRYMAPEQIRSTRDVDARADLWAMGIVLYELLAGRPPFDAETFPELCIRIATEEPSPLAGVRHVTPELAAVVDRCLQKDLRRRYAHVGELAASLAPFAPPRALPSVERVARILQGAGRMGGATPVSQEPRQRTVTAWSPSSSSLAAFTPPSTIGKKPRRLGLVAAATTVVVLAGASFAWWARSRPHAEGAAASASPIASLAPSPPPPAVSPVPAPPPPVASSAPPSPPPVAATETSPKVASPSPAPHRPVKPALTAHAATAPNCDPPFEIDADGIKRPKPECL